MLVCLNAKMLAIGYINSYLAFIKHSSHNTNTRKAAISVTFNKGHFDCIGYPEGFAHLYEHMLFNASLKYKNTNALDEHLF